MQFAKNTFFGKKYLHTVSFQNHQKVFHLITLFYNLSNCGKYEITSTSKQLIYNN